MMVQMLVHQERPFVWGERAEKRVGMRGASGGSSRDKAIDQLIQAIPFGFKVPVVSGYDKLL
jgi:hypothetical protein